MQVSIRELKANPAHAIAMMRRGELVQITSHRKVVAELVAPATSPQAKQNLTDEEAMQRLIDSGAVAQMPTKPMHLGELITFPPGPNGQTMSELVLDMRGPR
jgi:antitoxin (DNA-binding transcriptional repressor) of toxin-antitoxin stability system